MAESFEGTDGGNASKRFSIIGLASIILGVANAPIAAGGILIGTVFMINNYIASFDGGYFLIGIPIWLIVTMFAIGPGWAITGCMLAIFGLLQEGRNKVLPIGGLVLNTIIAVLAFALTGIVYLIYRSL